MILPLLLASALQVVTIGDAERIATKQAIERARDPFVLGQKPPFDQRYPRSLFERQVREEHQKEEVLRRVFGVVIAPKMLADEYDRIEKSTQAPEQWEAIRKAAHENRPLLEEVVCRPLLVDRILHVRFEFDQNIHSQAHAKARRARAAFLAGRKPAGVAVAVLSRHADAAESTESMLERARAESAVPRILAPPSQKSASAPLPVDPEAAMILDKELRKRGDISTIFEYRDRFEVYRLIEAKPASWKVDLVRFPKKNFDAWYETVRQGTPRSATP